MGSLFSKQVVLSENVMKITPRKKPLLNKMNISSARGVKIIDLDEL